MYEPLKEMADKLVRVVLHHVVLKEYELYEDSQVVRPFFCLFSRL